ncbi:MAG TPA: hypothetical protein VLM17_00950 [Xanthomonadaceae bacterium]|nr:hypothetical protein [Xanthomonadaceae bacterium]
MLLSAPLLGGTAAWAGPPRGRPAAPPAPPRADDPLSDSVRRIERTTRGQVLSAERVPFDGRNINRIKIVDERGRVRVYMDDPQTPPTQSPDPRDPPTRGDDD